MKYLPFLFAAVSFFAVFAAFNLAQDNTFGHTHALVSAHVSTMYAKFTADHLGLHHV